MAASTKSSYLSRRCSNNSNNNNYLFFAGDPVHNPHSELELDESDVWGGLTRSSDSSDPRPPPLNSRHVRRSSSVCGAMAVSLPVNVPDWAKILRGEYKDEWSGGSFDGGDDDVDGGDDDLMPPHEYLARTRMASLSVHEGVGRTLKGRDLSMVRNAIWEKTGFQD